MTRGVDTSYLVSAIVSTYNAERFIAGKLADLEAQTIADRLEIIVIDSASPQNERAVVEDFQRRYGNIRYLRTERRETVYQAWNRGVRMATGEFVTNANTDDRLRPDGLEILSDALIAHPERVLAYGDLLITEKENETFAHHTPAGQSCFPEFDPLFLLELCCIGPFPLWRRSLHDEIGYFDERLKSAADYEFWLRAALRHPFIHVPHFVGLYWLSPETVSRKGDLPTLEYLAVQKMYREKYAHLAPPPAPVPAEAVAELERLTRLAAEGGVVQGVRQLELLLERYPRWARGHHDLAELYYRKEDVGPARKHFEKAALLEPRGAGYGEKLANFIKIELYGALQYYTAAASQEPTTENHLALGMICQFTERFEMARQHYRKVLELEPGNPLAEKNLAALLLAGGEPSAAAPPLPPAAPGAAEPLVSIIILTYNELQCTRECLESIGRNTPEAHEIILVDNGSTDGTVSWLRELCAEDRRYRLVENGRNLGFAGGCNRGIAEAAGRYLLLLNNDTVVTRGWLGGMLRHLERDPRLGLVGPMSNEVAKPQRVSVPPYADPQELESWARSFRMAHLDRRIPVDRLAGFCLLTRREVVDRIGLLDTEFKTGNYEDDDFCLRAALAGYRLAIAGDVFIHHHGSRSFTGNGIDYAALMKANRGVFDAKWHLPLLDEPVAQKLTTHNAMTRASLLSQQGRLSEALDILLQEGIRFSPEDPAPYRLLAEILAGCGRWQDALDVLGKIPAGEELFQATLAGRCRLRLGNLPEGRALAQRALELSPGSAPALHLAALVALEDGDAERGAELLKRGMGVDPGYAPPYTALARLCEERGETRHALALAELGFMLAPCDMEALALYHRVAVSTGNAAAEEGRIREALELFPEHRGLHFALIDLLLTGGRLSEAITLIENAAARFGADDAMLDASLTVRHRLGPLAPPHEPGRPTLSLCMIVKDEAKHLPRCLESAKGIADEIVVIDTGSTDRTADIATLFGARVYPYDWSRDFAAARNASLAQARCGWILVLDADEVLAERDLEMLRALIASPTPAAYTMITRNYTESITRRRWNANGGEYPAQERGVGWTPSEKVRLFPNDPSIRFAGAVHELVEDSVLAAGLSVLPCDVPVHHYGKLDQVKGKEKQREYFDLGVRKLAADTEDVKALMELAVQATELNLAEEGSALWSRVLALEPHNCDAFFNLGYLQLGAGDFGEALASSRRALELDPHLKEAAFNAAKSELYLGRTEEALSSARAMLERWPDYPPALALASAAHLILGDREGRELVERLRLMRYDCGDYLRDLAGGLLQGGEQEQAVILLGHALMISPQDEESVRMLESCRYGEAP